MPFPPHRGRRDQPRARQWGTPRLSACPEEKRATWKPKNYPKYGGVARGACGFLITGGISDSNEGRGWWHRSKLEAMEPGADHNNPPPPPAQKSRRVEESRMWVVRGGGVVGR